MKANILLCSLFLSVTAFVAMGQEVKMPEPALDAEASLKEALENRRSEREYVVRPLDLQTMSNLLWAGWGYNRDDKRTAPSALDRQEITLYVCTKDGAYYYDANQHSLVKVVNKNIMAATGKQPFVENAAVNIVYVCNLPESASAEMTAVCCGAISQNISLYCASAGLATVVRGSFDAEQLKRLLKLSRTQKVVLAQSVGFPAHSADE